MRVRNQHARIGESVVITSKSKKEEEMKVTLKIESEHHNKKKTINS